MKASKNFQIFPEKSYSSIFLKKGRQIPSKIGAVSEQRDQSRREELPPHETQVSTHLWPGQGQMTKMGGGYEAGVEEN